MCNNISMEIICYNKSVSCCTLYINIRTNENSSQVLNTFMSVERCWPWTRWGGGGAESTEMGPMIKHIWVILLKQCNGPPTGKGPVLIDHLFPIIYIARAYDACILVVISVLTTTNYRASLITPYVLRVATPGIWWLRSATPCSSDAPDC